MTADGTDEARNVSGAGVGTGDDSATVAPGRPRPAARTVPAEPVEPAEPGEQHGPGDGSQGNGSRNGDSNGDGSGSGTVTAVAPPPIGGPPLDEVDDDGLPAEDEFERQRRLVRRVVDIVVVAACVGFVLWQLQPSLLVRNTTPAGGDMGAHVWGPAYLRDQLLPNFQLAGWTPDWYAGFPAYQFYMVVPSLVIVALGAGIHGPLALIPAAAGIALTVVAVRRRHEHRARNVAIAGAVVALLLVGLPYGVAFKWVSVSGLVTLPIAAYAFGRLSRFRFPTPAVLAVATLPFLFYRGFTIYGGNIASTLAGEFAFSMALSLAFVYLGVVMRGLETGRYRGWCALLLALTGLCHLIVAFWALGATAIIVAVRFNRSRAEWEPCVALIAAGVALLLNALLIGPLLDLVGGVPILAMAGLGVVAVAAGLWLISESVRYLTPVMVVAGLLASFWVGPFYLRRAYLNDMGWEKLPYTDQTLWEHLLPSKTPDVDLRWAFGLAVLGGIVSIVLRLRAGIFLLASSVAVGVAFVVMPEGRLWNGRLLPFYYLTILLLAAVAVAETVRLIVQRVRVDRSEQVATGVPTALATLVVTLVAIGLPLGALPFDQRQGAGFDWPSFSPLQAHAEPESFIPSWARWNYSGYEEKDSYREYYDVVRTMQQVGDEHGCGRAFWEYEKELDRYGTPMALMLLPHWTDGCIGSMEGLYFEASSTTPFHFLTQVELSTSPSAAQRDLPYGAFDIDRGVDHLQMLGVRYYMATSPQAVAAARQQADLTEVAASGPWVVFRVADSPLIEPLANEPAVLDDVHDSQREWLEEPLDDQGKFGGPAVRWFVDPTQWDVPLATSGPDDWQRIDRGEVPETRPVEPVDVSNVVAGRESISFDVDHVGTPVLVKVSYFPNWQVSGAEGPYRVTPNLMVVVPTDTHVELSYGRTWVEYVSYTLTFFGLGALVMLSRRGAYRFSRRAGRARPGNARPVATGPDATSPDATSPVATHPGDAAVPDGSGREPVGADPPSTGSFGDAVPPPAGAPIDTVPPVTDPER
jgi:6-pyruvoyl-tetrahydropterin synthase related domain